MHTPSYSRQRNPKHFVMILIFILLAVLFVFLYLFEKIHSSIGSGNLISEITTLTSPSGYEKNTVTPTMGNNQKTQIQEVRDEDLLRMAFITTPEAYSKGILDLKIETVSKECISLSVEPEITIDYTLTNISTQLVVIPSEMKISAGLTDINGYWLKFFYNEDRQLLLSYADVFDPGFTLPDHVGPYTEIASQKSTMGQLTISIIGEFTNSEDNFDGYSALQPGNYYFKLVLRGAKWKNGESIGYIASNLIPICVNP